MLKRVLLASACVWLAGQATQAEELPYGLKAGKPFAGTELNVMAVVTPQFKGIELRDQEFVLTNMRILSPYHAHCYMLTAVLNIRFHDTNDSGDRSIDNTIGTVSSCQGMELIIFTAGRGPQ